MKFFTEASALQRALNDHGYALTVDGYAGPQTLNAALHYMRSSAPAAFSPRDAQGDALAWSARVSAGFRRAVLDITEDFGWTFEHANWLMACMAFETGRSFDPAQKNLAGSGATGLIQFMPPTAKGLGTSTAGLAVMHPVEQLEYVKAYFAPYASRIHTLPDMYMAILMPAFVGSREDAVLFSGGVAYRQNSGLDSDRDGKVTKAEAAAKVTAMLAEGMRPENVAAAG
ncbi:hypothetical protein [Euryhalocaulis caribicus]|uniref:hypothetical protein n=1 Tax=Euryhalocaulis caribicus TaxID=1161401 RepID=UPI0003B4BD94